MLFHVDVLRVLPFLKYSAVIFKSNVVAVAVKILPFVPISCFNLPGPRLPFQYMNRYALLIFLWALSPSLFAAPPPCLSAGKQLPIDAQQVLIWKQTTPNQTLKRAHL